MTADIKNRWEKCLQIVKDNIGQTRFDTWFACARLVAYNDNKLTIGVPSCFYYEKYEDTFYEIFSRALKKTFGENVKLDYDVPMVRDDAQSHITIESPHQSHVVKNKVITSIQRQPIEAKSPDFDPQLNYSLNFENYCTGESNKLPVTIAEYVANNPGKPEFNPFFLYGNVGVGKTHLMQAIGIRIKEHNPNAKVLFVPMKQFQNLYANSTMRKDIPAFINWFSQMDVLLFDDLQELSNKTGTAEALFPIFNHLQRNRKNIIFTCDRPPMELDGIADRLIDRFKWGVVEPLPDPDYELRKKILTFKSKKNGLGLSEEIIDVIATEINGSVRELENIVNGLLTRSIIKNTPLSVELAREVMSHVVKPNKRPALNFDVIVETTAEYFNLNPDAIFSKSKLRDIADARQMIMYLCKKHTSLSSTAIGNKLNRRHVTVLHGISSIKDRLPYSKELSSAVNSIESQLLK